MCRNRFQSKNSQSLIFGGTICIADPNQPHVEAVGVENDAIIAVGSHEAVTAQLHLDARQIDLDGGHLMPGLIDTHVHTALGGFQERTIQFPDGLKNASEIIDFLASVKQDPRLKIGDSFT